MAGSAYFILEGEDSDGLGTSIGTAGNLNDGASGVQEFVIGTSNVNGIGAILLTGSSTGIDADGTNLSRISFTTDAGEGTGSVVLGGYDFNNDGVADVAISAPEANAGNGAVYIIYGSATALNVNLTPALLDGTNGLAINGFANSGGFGSSLAAVSRAGATDLLYIGGSHYGVADSSSEEGGVLEVNLSGITANVDATAYTTFGTDGGDHYGTSVAGDFDLDGDGISDLAVGAPEADGASASDRGEVIVTLSTGATVTLTGAAATDAAGTVVSSAGDLNNDGFDDLLISAPRNDAGGMNAGTVYVFYGKDASAPAFNESYDLGSLGANGIALSGSIANGMAGSVATSVGDVSGDGIADILVAGQDALGAGRAYLVFGGAAIASMNLENLDGTNGFVLGSMDLGFFDPVMTGAGIGDINNDGIGDLALGAPNAGDADNGHVFGILGGIENLAALDALDGAEDGNINVGNFLDGTPPTAAFIATDNGVTFGGTTTGAIDLSAAETDSEGTISIADVNDVNATFDTETGASTEGTGTYGSLVVDDDGLGTDLDRWIYTLGGASLLFLGAGESVADQIILTASNGSERAINITITGEDDPTEFTVTPNDTGYGLTEDVASVSGSFAVSDPDQNDNPNLNGQSIVGTYGTFVVSADGASFTYFLTADVSGLASGDSLTETISPSGTGGASFDLTIEGRDENNTPGSGAVYDLAGTSPSDGVSAFFGNGNETVNGTDNDDLIDAGAGDDTVDGAGGNDTIVDAFGNDTLSGGAGNDNITALSGTNTIDDTGGDANDSNYFKGGVGRDTITGGDGNDFIDGDAASEMIGAADRLDGGAGNDYMRGGLGADVFVFRTGGGDDIIADFEAVESASGGFALNGTAGRDFTVGLDTIELEGFAGVNAGNILTDYFADVDGNAVFTDGSDSLTLWDVSVDELTADSFVFIIV